MNEFEPETEIEQNIEKLYKISTLNEEFELSIKKNDSILEFKLQHDDFLNEYYYKANFDLEEINKLMTASFKGIFEVLDFFDIIIKDKKVKIIKSKDKEIISLNFKKDEQGKEINIKLEKNRLTKDQMYFIFIKEINFLKKKLKSKNEKTFDELIEENEEKLKEYVDKKIEESKEMLEKLFEEKIKEKDNKIVQLEKQIEKLKQEQKNKLNNIKNDDQNIQKIKNELQEEDKKIIRKKDIINFIKSDDNNNIKKNLENEDNIINKIYFNKANIGKPNDNKSKLNYSPKKEKPKNINDDIEIEQAKNEFPMQSEKPQEINLLKLLTTIFFKNPQMTEINTQKIDENYLDILRNEYYKHINDEKNIVYIYVNGFIKTNLLRIFKKPNIQEEILEIIKSKISAVLSCINMNKNYYEPYYYPNLKKKQINRAQSVKAAYKFRKEFNVSEEDINQQKLIDALSENNNDIYTVFNLFFG